MEVNESNQESTNPLLLKSNALMSPILDYVQQLHGDFGIAAIRSGFYTTYCNSYTRIGIIRCRHGPHKIIASTLPFINRIDSTEVQVNQLYLGATIKQCYKFIKNYQERKFHELCVNLSTEEQKNNLRKALLNLDVLDSYK